MWPEDFVWNWLSFSHRQDGDLIGLNLGSKWTDGTGANENGLCLNGKLYKISEDVVFSYNRENWMEPWTMKTDVTDDVDLVLTPLFDKAGGVDFGPMQAETHQMFGHFNGTVKAGGKTVKIKNAFGWAEEHAGGW